MNRKDFLKSYKRDLNEMYEKGHKHGKQNGIYTGVAIAGGGLILFDVINKLIDLIL